MHPMRGKPGAASENSHSQTGRYVINNRKVLSLELCSGLTLVSGESGQDPVGNMRRRATPLVRGSGHRHLRLASDRNPEAWCYYGGTEASDETSEIIGASSKRHCCSEFNVLEI